MKRQQVPLRAHAGTKKMQRGGTPLERAPQWSANSRRREPGAPETSPMSSFADSNVHVREVLNIVNNQLPTRPTSDSVAQSWMRCLKEFRLDPARFVMPPVLTQPELAARREAASDLIACSKLEMTTLYQQLAHPELAVVLVAADAVIVHQVASVPFGEAIAADGLRVGALWSEREAGTNGMGTCLAERECIAVYQHEHFYPRYNSPQWSAA